MKRIKDGSCCIGRSRRLCGFGRRVESMGLYGFCCRVESIGLYGFCRRVELMGLCGFCYRIESIGLLLSLCLNFDITVISKFNENI